MLNVKTKVFLSKRDWNWQKMKNKGKLGLKFAKAKFPAENADIWWRQ